MHTQLAAQQATAEAALLQGASDKTAALLMAQAMRGTLILTLTPRPDPDPDT